jgi:hypothetical protein
VRPRERRPVQVRAEITKTRVGSKVDAVLWTFTDPKEGQDNASV